MQTQTFSASSGAGGSLGLSNPPSSDFLDTIVSFNVPKGYTIFQGTVWVMDPTQPATSPASNISLPYGAAYSPTMLAVVPPYATNASATPKTIGVYQGPNITTTTNALGTVAKLRVYGVGLVLASGEGNVAVNVGSNLVSTLTQYGAKVATAALNSQIGQAIGYQVNGTIPLAIAAGAGQVVVVNTPQGIVGITTAVPLVIDTVASGVQETVTPSAVVSGVNANQAFTVAGSTSAGATLTTTINGLALVYTQLAGDTVTTAAAGIVQLINASTLVSGATPILLPATNAAGVVTVRANATGTGPNAITTVGASSAGFTYSAGAATLASGTNTSFTATFVNPHGTNTPYAGAMKTNAGTLILGTTSNAFMSYLINALIQIS